MNPVARVRAARPSRTLKVMHEARYYFYAFTYRYSFGGRRAGRTSCARELREG